MHGRTEESNLKEVQVPNRILTIYRVGTLSSSEDPDYYDALTDFGSDEDDSQFR